MRRLQKKIKKLIDDECRNEKFARLPYEYKLNSGDDCYNYIQWILFNEFENIKYFCQR